MSNNRFDAKTALAVLEQSLANKQVDEKTRNEAAKSLIDLSRRSRDISNILEKAAIEAENMANCLTALARTVSGKNDLTSLVKPEKKEEVPLTKKGKPRKKNKDGSYRKAPTMTPEQKEKLSQHAKQMNEERWHGGSGKDKNQN